MTRLLLRVVLALLGFAIATAAGAAIGDAATEADTAPLPPATANPVPLLDPIQSGEELNAAVSSPLDIDAPEGIRPVVTGSGGNGGGTGGGGDATEAEDGEVVEGQALPAIPVDTGGLPVPEFADLPILDVLQFRDPCADDEGGEGGDGDDCPVGEGAWIYGHIQPLQVRAHPYLTTAVDSRVRCSAERSSPTDVPVLLVSNNPAEITLTYDPDNGGPRTQTATVSEDERGRFDRRHESGAPVGASIGDGVHSCVMLEGFTEGSDGVYEVGVTAEDDFGGRFRGAFRLDVIGPRGRPPVTIDGVAASRLAVSAPMKSPQGGDGVDLAVLPRTEPDLSCEAIEGDRGRSQYLVEPVETELDPMQVGDPYDPSYTHRRYWLADLQEGTTYLVCLWWHGAQRFGDAADVEDREFYWVTTPDRLRLRMSIEEVAASRDLEQGSVRVTADGCGSEGGARVPAHDLEARETWVAGAAPQLVCDAGGTAAFGDFTTVRVSRAAGSSIPALETAIATPTRKCEQTILCPGPRVQRYPLEIPGPLAEAGLCAGGGDCDPGNRLKDGRMVLAVEFYDEGDEGLNEWEISGAQTYQGPAAEELPPAARVDVSTLRAEPVAGTTDSIAVSFDADRPVTATVYANQASGTPCPGVSVPSPDGLSQHHAVVVGGLCADETYFFSLVLVDEAGTSTEHSRVAYGPPLDLDVVTDHERNLAWSASTNPHVFDLAVTIEVRDASYELDGSWVHSPAGVEAPPGDGCFAHNVSALTRTSRIDGFEASDSIGVLVDVRSLASPDDRGLREPDGCATHNDTYAGTIRASVDTAELLATGEMTLESDPDDRIPLTVTLVATPHTDDAP